MYKMDLTGFDIGILWKNHLNVDSYERGGQVGERKDIHENPVWSVGFDQYWAGLYKYWDGLW